MPHFSQAAKKYAIDLAIPDGATRKIAADASKSARIGARALKRSTARSPALRVLPLNQPDVQQSGLGHRLVIGEEVVNKALRPLY